MRWFFLVCVIAMLTGRQLASARKFDDFDEDDFIPFTGERYDRFDWKLCEALDEREPGNVIASPISVKFLLSMIYEAATGETAKVLADMLQLHNTRAVTRVRTSALLKMLQAPNSNYSLDIGLRLYMDKRLHPKNWYKTVLAQYYEAYVKTIDFHDPLRTAKEINDWVNFATHGRIKNLIPDANTLAENLLLMISAVYFEGQWVRPFSVDLSHSGTFFTPEGPQPVKYMTQTGTFYYSESEELDAQFLRLPYKGGKFSMYIILPRRLTGLNQVLTNIRPFIMRRQMWALEETLVDVTLPVFTFEFTMNLKKILVDMGLEAIFTNHHELRGIVSSPSAQVVPTVSEVIQKASITVNEFGTIAAAATEARFTHKMDFSEVEFNATHPFVFFIEDEITGTVIFEGKLVFPKILAADLDVNPKPGVPKEVPDTSTKSNDLDRFINTPRPVKPEAAHPEEGPGEFPEKPHMGNLDGTPWELSKSP